jgi:hypothetical protein
LESSRAVRARIAVSAAFALVIDRLRPGRVRHTFSTSLRLRLPATARSCSIRLAQPTAYDHSAGGCRKCKRFCTFCRDCCTFCNGREGAASIPMDRLGAWARVASPTVDGVPDGAALPGGGAATNAVPKERGWKGHIDFGPRRVSWDFSFPVPGSHKRRAPEPLRERFSRQAPIRPCRLNHHPVKSRTPGRFGSTSGRRLQASVGYR